MITLCNKCMSKNDGKARWIEVEKASWNTCFTCKRKRPDTKVYALSKSFK